MATLRTVRISGARGGIGRAIAARLLGLPNSRVPFERVVNCNQER